MEIIQERPSPSEVSFTVRLREEEVAAFFEDSAKEVRREVSLPGYRKGKAPLAMVIRRFPAEVFDAARRRVAQASLRAALESAPDLTPLSEARIEGIENLREDAPLEIKATLEVMPEIELPKYRGLRLEAPSEEVTEADLEAMRRDLLDEAARFEDRDRPARHGDLVVLDYRCFEAEGDPPRRGAPIDFAEAEAYAVELGAGRTVPGFEREIEGVRPGETKTFSIEFPDAVAERRLAGRRVFVEATVQAVKEKIPPAWDDEFAKTLGYDGIDALEEACREGIARAKRTARRRALEDAALEALLDATPDFPLPKGQVREELARLKRRTERELAARGVALADTLAREGMDEGEFERRLRARAEASVRGFLILLKIAEAEGLSASEEDVAYHIAATAGEDPEEASARLDRRALARLRDEVLVQKALNLVLESAEVQERNENARESGGSKEVPT